MLVAWIVMGSVPMTVTEPPIQEGLSSPPATGAPADTAPALPLNNTSAGSAAASKSSRRHSKGQKHQKRAPVPLEPREKKQRRRRCSYSAMRRAEHRNRGHQPPPPFPSCHSRCAPEPEPEYQPELATYSQPAESDEQLAWQLHRDMLRERQPRRAAALPSCQPLAHPEADSSDDYVPDSDSDTDEGAPAEAGPQQAPLTAAAIKASGNKTVVVGTEPVVVLIPAKDGRHSSTLVAAVIPRLGAQVSQAATHSAWIPGLTMNGRHNKYVSQNFLHFTATSEPSMQDVCMGGTKGGNSGTFRFPTEAWSPAFEGIAEQASSLRPQGSLQSPVNFVMGRLYGTDGTWTHKEHTDGYSWSFPDARYNDATPVFSVGTATAAVSVTVSLVPCCSKMDDDPSVTLSFPETNATDAHVWCLFSNQLDQGALRVRHKVNVLKSVRHSPLPRIALVFRSVPAFSGGTGLGLYDLSQHSWVLNAMRLLMQRPAAAIAADLKAGTLGSKQKSRFRALIVHADVFGWPVLPEDRFLSVFVSPSANGNQQSGAILSSQPQLLKHFGYHSGNKSLSLGAIKVKEQWLVTSVLLDFSKWEILSTGALQGSGKKADRARYKNLLVPALKPAVVVCKGPDGDGRAAYFQIMEASSVAATLLRVLIKFSAAKPPPCVVECPLETNTCVYALGLATVASCNALSNSFTLEMQ